jgi:signal peptidase
MTKRVLRATLTALLVVVAVGVLTGVALIHFDHLQLEPVLSGSMRPVAQPGDLVVAQAVPTASLRVGEIVAFYPPGTPNTPVMHRILTLTRVNGSTQITTKGDANNAADRWGQITLTSHSTYHTIDVLPKLGFASVWAHNLAASKSAAILIGSGVLLLVLATSSLRRNRRSHGRPRGRQLEEVVAS